MTIQLRANQRIFIQRLKDGTYYAVLLFKWSRHPDKIRRTTNPYLARTAGLEIEGEWYQTLRRGEGSTVEEAVSNLEVEGG